MGELFAARQGRSAWRTVLPLGQFALQNLPFQTRSSLLNQPASWRGSPARGFALRVGIKLCLNFIPRSGYPLWSLDLFPTQLSVRVVILSGVRVVFERRGNAANTAANLAYEDVLLLEARSAKICRSARPPAVWKRDVDSAAVSSLMNHGWAA